MRKTSPRKYKITYAPTVKVVQKAVDPYDEWNADNAIAPFFYTSVPNHDKSYEVSVVVEAVSKDTAKAILSVELYQSVMGREIEGGYAPLINDTIRNIKRIEEVEDNE